MDRDCAAVPCTRGYTTDACPTREGDGSACHRDIACVARTGRQTLGKDASLIYLQGPTGHRNRTTMSWTRGTARDESMGKRERVCDGYCDRTTRPCASRIAGNLCTAYLHTTRSNVEIAACTGRTKGGLGTHGRQIAHLQTIGSNPYRASIPCTYDVCGDEAATRDKDLAF